MSAGLRPKPKRLRVGLRFTSSYSWRAVLSDVSMEEPIKALTVLGLERRDRGLVLQGDADVVEAFQQALLAEAVDLEAVRTAIRCRDSLRRQVDLHRRSRPGVQLL